MGRYVLPAPIVSGVLNSFQFPCLEMCWRYPKVSQQEAQPVCLHGGLAQEAQ